MSQLRFVSWAAVSSLPQAKKISLDDQLRSNKEHIEKWGGTLVAELIVPGVSRRIVLFEDAARRMEAYAQLKELIDRRAFDVLICYDLSRFGRKDSLITAVAGLCEEAGIRVYETTSPPATLDTPLGTFDTRMLTAFKGVMYEQEGRKFAERSLMGRQARVKKGKHSGNPPYGYKRVYDQNGISSTIVDEEAAPIVKLFYDLYLNHGRSLTAICEEFNTRGYVSPYSKNPWVPGTARQFLRNCWAYAGYTSWGVGAKHVAPDTVFRAKAEWPALITEDMAREAERIMRERAAAPRSGKPPYRMSMVGRCGYCGHILTCKSRAGYNGCITNRFACTKDCRNTSLGEHEILAAIEQAILDLGDNDTLEALVEETPSHLADLVDRFKAETKAMEQIRAERKRLTLAFTREAISLTEYESIMAELQQRHDNIAHTVAELENVIATTPTADSHRSRLENIRDRGLEFLHHADLRTANNWLRQHVTVYVQDHKPVFVRFKID